MRINLGFPHRLSADGTIDHDESIVLVLSIAANALSLPTNLGVRLAEIRRMDLRTAIFEQPLSDRNYLFDVLTYHSS